MLTTGHHVQCLAFIIHTWTPYQMLIPIAMNACTPSEDFTYQAITPRLNTGQRLPYSPKLVLATTGKVIWKIAPGRAFNTMNGATTVYPIQTQIHACHQDNPSCTMDETIIQLYVTLLASR